MVDSSDETGKGHVTAVSERLDEIVERLAARTPSRQAIVAVENGDRSFRWARALGEAPDGAKVRVDSPFFIASIDKLYNATLVLKLSEDGRVDLDEPISAHLPTSITNGLHRIGNVDYSSRISVRHLLGHTSGLADWLEDRPKGGPSLVERVLEDGDVALGIEDIARIVREELKPHFPPQELSAGKPKVRYSDTNFILLIAVIEAVTGRPLHEVHERLLIRPLGLRHTYFAGLSTPLEPTPQCVVLRAAGQPLAIPHLMRSIRGMYSTARDVIAFLRALLSDELFQHPATLDSMQERWNRFGFPLDRAALRAPGWPIEYGLGIMRFRPPRFLSPWHPMPAVIGHTGSTGCWLFYCQELDTFLAGSVDEVTAGAVPYRIVPRILRVLRSSS